MEVKREQALAAGSTHPWAGKWQELNVLGGGEGRGRDRGRGSWGWGRTGDKSWAKMQEAKAEVKSSSAGLGWRHYRMGKSMRKPCRENRGQTMHLGWGSCGTWRQSLEQELRGPARTETGMENIAASAATARAKTRRHTAWRLPLATLPCQVQGLITRAVKNQRGQTKLWRGREKESRSQSQCERKKTRVRVNVNESKSPPDAL